MKKTAIWFALATDKVLPRDLAFVGVVLLLFYATLKKPKKKKE
jgi:hypothetical protein